ncbi:hypothetical protein ACHQM5_016606 [Ranunculus cassubicifolius]
MAPPSRTTTVAAGQQPQPRPPHGGFFNNLTGSIRIAVFMYLASRWILPNKKPLSSTPAQLNVQISNLFHKAETLDMWLYVSEHQKFTDFANEEALIWHETNIPYADYGPGSTRSLSIDYHLSEALKNNGSLYAHVYFARSGFTPDPTDPEYQPIATFGSTTPIVTYLPKMKLDKRKSLLGGSKDSNVVEQVSQVIDETQPHETDSGPPQWISYWKPNITINLVEDFTAYSKHSVPPNIAPYLITEPKTGNYYPTVYFNEFWLLRSKYLQLNESLTEVPLHLEVGPISMTKWQFYLQIDQSFQMHRNYGSMLEGEADELKRVWLEGNPILLMITMAVSLLHSVFDFLAFKNDVQFWNKNKSMEGLSAKTIVVNFACQLIVFLYLLDNDTSWMILASSAVGCCIEFWKIGKAMHIDIDRSGRIPTLRFRDRDSYSGNKTKEYDDMAMKYLSYVLFFLVTCSSIYSLKYERHRSWYSWILSSLTSCVYMFGFIMMCPQLFINYKLKSVAHLPWRQMTYKFLNTIVDDLFAFVIKMPWLHRLSVFRDDLIFLIIIYQRWIYPVDKKRVNEFGFGGEDDDQTSTTSDVAAIDGVPAKAEAKKTK